MALTAVRDTISPPGHPLDPGVQTGAGSRLGYNFADVRVHSDRQADTSALAVKAQAYAVGRHVVFAPGQYQPTRSDGRQLIAHELEHVAAHDLGGLACAAAGFVGGALLGSLFGPIGAIVGGVLGAAVGGIAGLVIGDTATTPVRVLTSAERTEAQKVFGNNLQYDRVRLGESPIMGSGGNARTPFETIYFPPGAHADPGFIPWLIHELTHVWQTQHGVSVVSKLWWALHSITGNPYDFGGERGLVLAASQGRRFASFNTEQQGDICRSYYNALTAGQNTSAFDPFIQEVTGLAPATPRSGTGTTPAPSGGPGAAPADASSGGSAH